MWSIMYKVQMFHFSVIWFTVVHHLQNSDVLSCSVFTVFTVSLCHCVHCSYDCLVCGVFMYKIQMFYRVQVSEVFCVDDMLMKCVFRCFQVSEVGARIQNPVLTRKSSSLSAFCLLVLQSEAIL